MEFFETGLSSTTQSSECSTMTYFQVVTAFPDRYEPGKEDMFALAPSMVALAATAVRTSYNW